MWKNTITFFPTNTEKDLKEVFLWLSIHLKTENPLEKNDTQKSRIQFSETKLQRTLDSGRMGIM